jgi:PAS domain S-box-containing protein
MSSPPLPAQANQLFHYLFEQASLGIAVEDLEGKLLLANPSLCSMLGYSENELLVMSCSQFANPEDSAEDWALFQQLRAGVIDKYSLEKRYVRKDGTQIWGNLNVSLLKNAEAGSPPLVFAFVEDITKRKRSEEELRRRDMELSEAQRLAGVGGWQWDRQTDTVIWSKELYYLMGLDPTLPALSYKEHALLFAAESWERLQRAVQEALETGTSYELDLEVVRPGSIAKWEIARGEAVRDANGQILGLRGTVQDITARKEAEKALRQSEERIRLAMQASKSVGWEWDLKSGQDSWFGDLRSVFGISADTFVGRTDDFFHYVYQEDRQMVAKAVAHARQSRTPYAAEFRIVRLDGAMRWVEATGKFYYGADGEPDRMLGMASDVTERKWAEVALRESDQRLRLAVQAGRMYAFEWDVATDVIVRSKESVPILNWKDAERDTGREFHARIHADDRVLYDAMEAKLTPEDPNYQMSFRALAPDGTVIWLEDTGRAYFDAEGKMVRVVGMVADITDRKRAEQAMRESEDKLRLLLDSTAEAIYGIDLQHRCTFCNPACLRTLGYEGVDEVLGKNMHDLLHHSRADGAVFPADECRIHRTMHSGVGLHVEDEVFWRANGTSFPAEYWSYPQRRGGEVVGAVVTFIDITERKLAEAALATVSRRLIEAQEQERARIGRELHDDVGQRLALLAVELRQLQDGSVTLTEVRRRAGELHKQASAIAADIQSLSHELHSAKLQYLGIASAMRGFCQEFSQQQRVEVEFNFRDLPAPLSADISLCLFRVLQEALHNSAKHSGARHFEVRLWGATDEVHLTVKDSGAGFDLETAKMSGGLGLISMQERLKLANGTLSIESLFNRGTTIHACIPLGSARESMRQAG